MPSLSSQRNTSPSSSSAVTSIVERFRTTNAIYKHRAQTFRVSLRLTSHARHRALLLNLKVDTDKAVKCDQRQVSVIPLPIIDTEPSPLPFQELHWVQEDSEQTLPRSVGSCSSSSSSSSPSASSARDEKFEDAVDGIRYPDSEVIIDLSQMVRQAAKGGEPIMSPIARPQHRPALRCVIPTISLNAPGTVFELSPSSSQGQQLRSQFSPDTEWSAISLTSAVSSSIGPKGQRVSDVDDAAPVMQNQAARKSTIIIPAPSARRHQDLPTEAHRMSWGCGEISSVAEVDLADSEAQVVDTAACSSASGSSSAVSASGSTSSSSSSYGSASSGLNTPEDTLHQGGPLMIRIKRSNASISEDDAESDIGVHLDKRPKFERKGWAQSYAKSGRARSLDPPSSVRSTAVGAAGRR
ncbi:hypothetical protein DFP72DRAFT_540 [Ephemerocybe angulata]|uniref:Uncharacterized protein n=1 Tax=Ephemerocybe angulata TaxID=980116 RepID=A0A8H6IJX6_9AGAR|nr:hypothetical protein DFP72DRAFT_540 [Tulosesus angulatus]